MFKLHFTTGNAAFDDGMATEVADILRRIARKVLQGHTEGACMDSNGNAVGTWECLKSGPDDD